MSRTQTQKPKNPVKQGKKHKLPQNKENKCQQKMEERLDGQGLRTSNFIHSQAIIREKEEK